MLCISAKIYLRAFGLAATLDPKSNIYNNIKHDSSLSESGCNTGPKSFGCESDCKVVS